MIDDRFMDSGISKESSIILNVSLMIRNKKFDEAEEYLLSMYELTNNSLDIKSNPMLLNSLTSVVYLERRKHERRTNKYG